MSNLVIEILLRLAKAGIAARARDRPVPGPGRAARRAGSAELALLCWLSGAAFVLLVETGFISEPSAARFGPPASVRRGPAAVRAFDTRAAKPHHSTSAPRAVAPRPLHLNN